MSWTLVCLFLSTSLFAARITGKVTNGTTGKPAAGEEVVLLSLAGGGMDEASHAKTGNDGTYSLDVPDPSAQYLVRAAHEGVNYFRAVSPGTTSLDITIYDAAKTINNLVGEGRVFQFEASANELEVTERYILVNQSQPPRTWMGDHTFEIVLPDGARIEDGLAAGPGNMPIASAPIPTGKPNQYAFVYPIRPGRSELRVTYRLPYSGSHDFSLTAGMPLGELGVMLSKRMRLDSRDGVLVPAPDVDGMTVFVAKNLVATQRVSFSVSGEGTAPSESQSGSGTTPSAAPGGGLGTPSGSPEPMSNTRWYILGGVTLIMAAFAIWMLRRKPANADIQAAAVTPARTAVKRATVSSVSSAKSASSVLDALKEELFQLETDRAEGKISEPDYVAAKAGLDTLFRRQMKNQDEARHR